MRGVVYWSVGLSSKILKILTMMFRDYNGGRHLFLH